MSDETAPEAATPLPDFLGRSVIHCSRCGESLIGIDEHGRCRCCGLPVAVSRSGADFRPIVDPDGKVAADMACRKCSYNLRGLSESGQCPECGTAVVLSTRGDLLSDADPAWVRRIALGSTLISAGILATLIGVVVSLTFLIVPGTGFPIIPAMLGVLAYLGGLILLGGGLWFITTPDPRHARQARKMGQRRLIRACMALAVLHLSIDFVIGRLFSTPATAVGKTLGDAIATVIVLIGTVAYYGYLKGLSERLPSGGLNQRAASIRLWLGVGWGIIALVDLIDCAEEIVGSSTGLTLFVLPRGDITILAVVYIGSSLVAAVIFAVNAIRAIVLQRHFTKAAREQAERAELNWSGASVAKQADE